MIQVICRSSLLSVPGGQAGRGGGGGGLLTGIMFYDFTTSLECRAFSMALKIEKLKAPLIPGPKGAVDTNDWCITEQKIPRG